MIGNVSYTIIYLLCNMVLVLTIRTFLITFLKERRVPIAAEICGYVLYYVSISVIYLLFHTPLLTMVVNFTFLMILSTFYTASVRRVLLYATIIYVILGMAEALAFFASTHYISILLSHSYESTVGVIIVRVISYSGVFVLYHKKKVTSSVRLPIRLWFGFLLIPLASIIIVIALFSGYYITGLIVPLSVFSILLINILSFYLLELSYFSIANQYEEKISEEQLKYFQSQIEIMEQSLNNYRTIRHDIRNLVSPLHSLIQKEEYNELANRYQELMELCSMEDSYAISGHSTIDSILNFKLENAKSRGVDVEVKTKIPKDLKIPTLDIAIILGNLIDNALEASEFITDKKVCIELKYTRGRLFITVTNNYDGYIKQSESELITRKDNIDEHGFGIKSVKGATEKHNGELMIYYDESTFTAKAMIFL